MVLINHTNHESLKWSEKQKAGFSKIIDLPFPSIDPRLSYEGVRKIAEEKLSVIHTIMTREGEQDEVAICLQGEFSYCFCLFEMLLNYYSTIILIPTTERKVVETGNTKTAVFEFVQWRRVS